MYADAGKLFKPEARALSDEALQRLVRAGAYSRTIDRLVSDECGIYGLAKPLTESDIMAMPVEQILSLISRRYG